jgi:hypothetical protein
MSQWMYRLGLSVTVDVRSRTFRQGTQTGIVKLVKATRFFEMQELKATYKSIFRDKTGRAI